MKEFLEIISRRSMPGVLIFDRDERLLYANSEALELVPGLADEPIELLAVWDEVHRLLAFLKEHPAEPASRRNVSPLWVMENGDGSICSLRASYLGAAGKGGTPTHVMVLVERVVEKHGVDLERAGRLFGLSKREQQVLQLVCQGFMNRDIGERLFISEYTVKDHLKNIMKKMGVGTRSEIMAALQ